MTVVSGSLDTVLQPLLPGHLDTLNTSEGFFLTYDTKRSCWRTSCVMPKGKELTLQRELVFTNLCRESLTFLAHDNRATLASRVNAFYTDQSTYRFQADKHGQIRFNSKVKMPGPRFLSNFEPTLIARPGFDSFHPSVESLFSYIMADRLGCSAKIDRLARPVTIKKAWGNVRAEWLQNHEGEEEFLTRAAVRTMRFCTDLKYDQNPVFAALLVDTDDADLVEQSTSSLVFGSDRVVDDEGVAHETGANELGRILEEKRARLKEEGI